MATLEEEKKALEAKSWMVGLTEWLGNTWIFLSEVIWASESYMKIYEASSINPDEEQSNNIDHIIFDDHVYDHVLHMFVT